MTDSDPELPEEVTKDFKKDWEPKGDFGRHKVETEADKKKKLAHVILNNYQMLMKCALDNDQVSFPQWMAFEG